MAYAVPFPPQSVYRLEALPTLSQVIQRCELSIQLKMNTIQKTAALLPLSWMSEQAAFFS